jgi:mitogen-activated protein kinase 1/3
VIGTPGEDDKSFVTD